MTLQQKLEQYGQFGEGDMPAIKEILALAGDVARMRFELTECQCGKVCEGCPTSDAVRLHEMIDTLVDGRSVSPNEAVGFDNLWATISDTHGRWDEGEIDNATAKAECDAAINGYLGTAPKKEDTSNLMETPLQGTINVHEAFVTMTVPMSIAMRVADNELGDSHYDAVCNLEMMLAQDMDEEYGIDTAMAQDYHASLGCYGDDVKKNGWGEKNDKEVK